MQISLSRQEYTTLGMRLVSEKPTIAAELLSVVHPEPTQTDVSLIPTYYRAFSNITRSGNFDTRMLFIACMIRMYQPSAYENKKIINIERLGVLKQIGIVLTMNKSAVSKWARKAIVSYKVYSEFSELVEKVMEGME